MPDLVVAGAGMAGLVVTLTQLGYGTGLLLLVPLADVVENRRLILVAMAGAVLGLAGVALSNSAATFLGASFVVGLCAVAAQVLVPFASHLAPEAGRGRVVGNIMGGLIAGIMLARPFSSPPSSGVIASRIDTAPRSPTHDTKAVSGREKRNGARQSQTETGRATKISTRPSATAAGSIAGNSEGVANRPSTRNMMICASHDTPSWKRFWLPAPRRLEFPATSPAR